MNKESHCGAKNCCQNKLGYQVHITFSGHTMLDSVLIDELKELKTEIVILENYIEYPAASYTEYITSTNTKTLNEAIIVMSKLNNYLTEKRYKVLRMKIEAHPDTPTKYWYSETHYKISEEEASRLSKNGFKAISKNHKGSLFATVRLDEAEDYIANLEEELKIKAFNPHKITFLKKTRELVIFDSNRPLDNRWINDKN
jgi:hypothetical protein